MQRSYNVSLPHNKIPDTLCELGKKLAAPAMPRGEDFQPEAAIVNYFGLGTVRCAFRSSGHAYYTLGILINLSFSL